MLKKSVIVCLVFVWLTIACSLGTSGAQEKLPAATLPVGQSAQSIDDTQTGPAFTEETSRSASIDLLPGSSGPVTPTTMPALPFQPTLSLLPQEWYPQNTAQQSGNLSVIVLGWGIPSGEVDQSAGQGFKYIWVDVIYHNQSSDYLYYWPEGQAKLTDEAGQSYALNNVRFRYESTTAGQYAIAPGEHLRHELFFTVPETVSDLTFQFDICVGNKPPCGPVVQFSLGKGIVHGEAPAVMNLPDDGAKALGDVVNIGSRAVSVIRWAVSAPSSYPAGTDAPAGTNLISANVLIANLGQKEMAADATGGMWINLKDQTGRYFVRGPGGFANSRSIAPGEWLQGYVSFFVPPGTQGLELVFDFVPPGESLPVITRSFIQLGEQPAVSDSAFEQMPGSIAPNAVLFGQAGQVENFELTVQKVDFPNTSACGEVDPGNRVVLVTVRARNTGGVKELTAPLQAFLKDSHGNQYLACNTKDDSLVNGGLDPGAGVNIIYTFEVLDLTGEIALIQHVITSDEPKKFFALD